MSTPNLHRAKIAQKECGWKDGDRGGLARMQRKHRKKGENKKRKPSLQEGKRKSLLTLTGLLMEGVEADLRKGFRVTFRCAITQAKDRHGTRCRFSALVLCLYLSSPLISTIRMLASDKMSRWRWGASARFTICKANIQARIPTRVSLASYSCFDQPRTQQPLPTSQLGEAGRRERL